MPGAPVAARRPPVDPWDMDTTFDSAPAGGWLRAAVRPLATTRGWTTLLHHLLGLPLGLAYLIWLVTGLALGAGLAITLIGIPILTLVLASVRPLLAFERGLANSLLGAGVPAAALAPRSEAGIIARFKAYWTDAATWRGLGYLLVRFPAGLATFTVAVILYATAGWLLAAPLLAPLGAMDFGDLGAGRPARRPRSSCRPARAC